MIEVAGPNHMTTIHLLNQFGTVCADPENGAEMCSAVAEKFRAGEHVRMDCEGVQTLTGSFLNAAVGCLYGSFEPSFIDEHLTWTGLDSMDLRLVDLVVRNAIRFWAARGDQQRRIIEASEPVGSA